MSVVTKRFTVCTKGDTDIIDITEKVQGFLSTLGIDDGLINVSIAGSTAAITTCEYEPGLVKDLKDFFQKIIPQSHSYHHNVAWADGNGHAHVRSSFIDTSKSFSFSGKALNLGTWQQIILIDFDNRSRSREIIVQIVGE